MQLSSQFQYHEPVFPYNDILILIKNELFNIKASGISSLNI